MAEGTLFLVATPIGNLGDVSSRARECLADCDLVACEDKRITVRLLRHLGIETKLINYRDDNETRAAEELLALLKQGKKIALVSDAGTPAISDPGFRITRLCRREGIEVVPIPGCCAGIAALSVSGLPSDAFLFLGFLPPKKAARIRIFTQFRDFPHSLILYESPHRITKCLDDLVEVVGVTRCVCVAREITKMHETILTGPVGSVRTSVMERSLKGEFVIVIAPNGFEL